MATKQTDKIADLRARALKAIAKVKENESISDLIDECYELENEISDIRDDLENAQN